MVSISDIQNGSYHWGCKRKECPVSTPEDWLNLLLVSPRKRKTDYS